MTEGPNAHLIADRLRTALTDKRLLRVEWPSGPQQDWAGRRIRDVECHGKELFLHLDRDQTFRIHLLMAGKIRILTPDEAVPADPKLLLHASTAVVAVIGRPSIQLMSRGDAEKRMAALGPDPLRRDFDAGRVRRNLQAQGPRSIGECLLDQSVIAGIGNMWKSEILYEARWDPRTPAETLDLKARSRLVRIAAAFLRHCYDSHRTRRRVRLRVYNRTGKPCLECGTTIEGYQLGGRRTYSCPACQGPQRTV